MTLFKNISKEELDLLLDKAAQELELEMQEKEDRAIAFGQSEAFQSFLSNFNTNSSFEDFIEENENATVSLISDALRYLDSLENMYIFRFYDQESFVMINNILVRIDDYDFKIMEDNSAYYDYFEKMNELYAFHSELSELIKDTAKSKQLFSEIELIYLQKDLADMTPLLYRNDNSQSRDFLCSLDDMDESYYKDSSINFHKRLSYFMERLQ